MIDPVDLTARLIQCPSVTPEDAGALDVLQASLEPLGFVCQRLPFGEGAERVDNLYARLGTARPHICFAGHTDVVPIGDRAHWSDNPFGGTIRDGAIWGRGASDMKGAIAAFVAAVDRFIASQGQPAGSISLLITGDEEGPSINGTVKLVEWLRQKGEEIDGCIVGEPTNPEALGDMVKIGRRGSVNGILTVTGVQGHVAYPHLAQNPVPDLLALAAALMAQDVDAGTEHFQPSNLEITSVDVGNSTTNIIPATATARFNIRYNDLWTRDSIAQWVNERLAAVTTTARYELELTHSADCFRTDASVLLAHLVPAIERVSGLSPQLSTTGGTSDARFIKDICPVVEFGLIGQTMHKVDENVPLEAVTQLSEVYFETLVSYFSG